MGRKAPSATPLLIEIDASAKTPLFQQIYEGVRGAIVSGRLRPGQQVPSTRMLAEELRVARSTVVLAYDQLYAEGYLEGTSGAGSFVSRSLPDARPRSPAALVCSTPVQAAGSRRVAARALLYERAVLGAPQAQRTPVAFRIGEPALDEFPVRIWASLLRRRAATSPRTLLRHAEPEGYRPLREAIAAYLVASRGVRAEAEQVILVRGTQQAIDVVGRVLFEPGDAVWIEDPAYLSARTSFTASGATVVPVPVDRDGLVVASGRRLAAAARAAYVAPSHQFPLGSTLSLVRRLELLRWASEAGAWIIEDDVDSEFRYDGPPMTALQGLDADDRVIYVGTFSKTLFPALRLGYMVVPRDLVRAFTVARTLEDYMLPTVEQAVVTDFIRDGYFARHVRRMRTLYRERRDALADAIGRELRGVLRVDPAPAGMHLVGWLPPGIDDRAVARAALAAGIEVPPLSLYSVTAPLAPALLLGYAAVDESSLRQAVFRLRPVLAELRPVTHHPVAV